MPFGDFYYPDVIGKFGLTLDETDLFPELLPLEQSAEFVRRLRAGIDLALAVNTEKARSEFIIAPILLELRSQFNGTFGLFSGVVLDVDSKQGLNGVCDFILTKSPLQSVLTAPLIAITEAKNDNLVNGLGQCIAAMVAAREFNDKAGRPIPAVYGGVTTGAAWRFLRLAGPQLSLDRREYFVAELGQVMGVLAHILRTA